MTPTLFASHSFQAQQENAFSAQTSRIVIDIAGSATLPFLQSLLNADVSALTVAGMGLHCAAMIDNQACELDVYYFSESAFRLVVNQADSAPLIAHLLQAEDKCDIDVITRSDLNVMAVFGCDAFDMLLEEFALTPGIILQGQAQRYARQSGNVLLTATHLDSHQGYELIAKHDDLAKLQQRFSELGFAKAA